MHRKPCQLDLSFLAGRPRIRRMLPMLHSSQSHTRRTLNRSSVNVPKGRISPLTALRATIEVLLTVPYAAYMTVRVRLGSHRISHRAEDLGFSNLLHMTATSLRPSASSMISSVIQTDISPAMAAPSSRAVAVRSLSSARQATQNRLTGATMSSLLLPSVDDADQRSHSRSAKRRGRLCWSSSSSSSMADDDFSPGG